MTSSSNHTLAYLARYQRITADIRPHINAWTNLLRTHVNSLPPDRAPDGHDDGCSDQSYAGHELAAMVHALNALRLIDAEFKSTQTQQHAVEPQTTPLDAIPTVLRLLDRLASLVEHQVFNTSTAAATDYATARQIAIDAGELAKQYQP